MKTFIRGLCTVVGKEDGMKKRKKYSLKEHYNRLMEKLFLEGEEEPDYLVENFFSMPVLFFDLRIFCLFFHP